MLAIIINGNNNTLAYIKICDNCFYGRVYLRGGETQRSCRWPGGRTAAGNRFGAYLNETGRAGAGENFSSCLVHILVRCANAADVYPVSMSLPARWFLAHAGNILRDNSGAVCAMGVSTEAVWHYPNVRKPILCLS